MARTSFPTRSEWEANGKTRATLAKHLLAHPGTFESAQEPKFATERTSLFGLVFREAGTVVPSTFDVVLTNVAESFTEDFKRMAFLTGCEELFFGFTTGGVWRMRKFASLQFSPWECGKRQRAQFFSGSSPGNEFRNLVAIASSDWNSRSKTDEGLSSPSPVNSFTCEVSAFLSV